MHANLITEIQYSNGQIKAVTCGVWCLSLSLIYLNFKVRRKDQSMTKSHNLSNSLFTMNDDDDTFTTFTRFILSNLCNCC